jgi:hypothetical protein
MFFMLANKGVPSHFAGMCKLVVIAVAAKASAFDFTFIICCNKKVFGSCWQTADCIRYLRVFFGATETDHSQGDSGKLACGPLEAPVASLFLISKVPKKEGLGIVNPRC